MLPSRRTPDGDRDGLTNGYEDRLGLDPTDADSDGDLVPDGAEDTDGDGLDDFAERVASDIDNVVADLGDPGAEVSA